MCKKKKWNAVLCSMIGNDASRVRWIANEKLRILKIIKTGKCVKKKWNAVLCSMMGNDPSGVKWIATNPAFLPAHLSLAGNIKS